MVRYFLWVNLYAAMLFALYMFFLRDRSNHRWSRFYLLSVVIIAILFPGIKVNTIVAGGGTIARITQSLPEVVLTTTQDTKRAEQNWFLWAYVIVAVVMAVRLLYRILKLKSFLKKLDFIDGNGYRIAFNTNTGPASFGNSILFPDSEPNPDILKHELAHLSNKHHYDKLFMEITLCLYFPVIAFYFVKKELENIHEFEADAFAADDNKQYAILLLNEHFYTQQFDLLQSFFYHPIKRRIKMLYKKETSQTKYRGILVLLSGAILAAGLIFQSGTAVKAQEKKIAKEGEEEVYTMVEQMPEFPGGQDSLFRFLAGNIKYPEAARKANIQGKVIAKFVVSSTGKVKNISIVRSPDDDMSRETIRVLSMMPDWKTGKQNGRSVSVYYTLPVSFKLGK